ncbi:MAG: helix-turn-helix transcriptional regulator [Victivallales bacterium]|nr:helix-turn-helix transcriptional regulator [Victivallales bacterium]
MLRDLKKLSYIGIYQAPAGRSIQPLIIPQYREKVELLISGKVFFEVDGVERTFTRGAMFWHISGESTIYRYPPDEPYSCYAAQFVVEASSRPCPRATWPADIEFLLEFMKQMFQRFHSTDGQDETLAPCVYSTLVCLANGPQTQSAQTLPRPLAVALRYLERHLSSNLHIADLAQAAGVSPDYLHSLFRQHLARSPHQELLRLRINRAKQLLSGSSISIKQIAFDCGFNSTEVFYRQFAALANTTPALYRKRCQPPEEAGK